MANEIDEQEIRDLAYILWQDAGSPEGEDHAFWVKAEEMLAKKQGQVDIDTASEESFPASDPVNDM